MTRKIRNIGFKSIAIALNPLTVKKTIAFILVILTFTIVLPAAVGENEDKNKQISPASVSSPSYELTQDDIFNVKESFSSDSVKIMGIALDMPLAQVLPMFDMTEKNISRREGYLFLDIKPGFRLRLKETKIIDALIIGKEFQPFLKGETATFFNSGSTTETFVEFVKRFFPNPSDVKTHSDGSFVHDSVVFKAGFEFIRVGAKGKPSLIIQITKSKPGAVMRKN